MPYWKALWITFIANFIFLLASYSAALAFKHRENEGPTPAWLAAVLVGVVVAAAWVAIIT